MRTCDYLSLAGSAPLRDVSAPRGDSPPGDGPQPWDDSERRNAHLAEADLLISDLAALVDAGLLIVHEHVLGPARYGVAPTPDRVA